MKSFNRALTAAAICVTVTGCATITGFVGTSLFLSNSVSVSSFKKQTTQFAYNRALASDLLDSAKDFAKFFKFNISNSGSVSATSLGTIPTSCENVLICIDDAVSIGSGEDAKNAFAVKIKLASGVSDCTVEGFKTARSSFKSDGSPQDGLIYDGKVTKCNASGGSASLDKDGVLAILDEDGKIIEVLATYESAATIASREKAEAEEIFANACESLTQSEPQPLDEATMTQIDSLFESGHLAKKEYKAMIELNNKILDTQVDAENETKALEEMTTMEAEISSALIFGDMKKLELIVMNKDKKKVSLDKFMKNKDYAHFRKDHQDEIVALLESASDAALTISESKGLLLKDMPEMADAWAVKRRVIQNKISSLGTTAFPTNDNMRTLSAKVILNNAIYSAQHNLPSATGDINAAIRMYNGLSGQRGGQQYLDWLLGRDSNSNSNIASINALQAEYLKYLPRNNYRTGLPNKASLERMLEKRQRDDQQLVFDEQRRQFQNYTQEMKDYYQSLTGNKAYTPVDINSLNKIRDASATTSALPAGRN